MSCLKRTQDSVLASPPFECRPAHYGPFRTKWGKVFNSTQRVKSNASSIWSRPIEINGVKFGTPIYFYESTLRRTTAEFSWTSSISDRIMNIFTRKQPLWFPKKIPLSAYANDYNLTWALKFNLLTQVEFFLSLINAPPFPHQSGTIWLLITIQVNRSNTIGYHFRDSSFRCKIAVEKMRDCTSAPVELFKGRHGSCWGGHAALPVELLFTFQSDVSLPHLNTLKLLFALT